MEQHTLSKFYITGFHDLAEKPSKNPSVWYLSLEEPPPRRWRRERARDISARADYYNLANAPPERRLALENLFGSVETAAADPLRALARGELHENLGAVSLFIALMMAKPPNILEGLAAFSGRVYGWPDTTYPNRARNRPDVVAASAAIAGVDRVRGRAKGHFLHGGPDVLRCNIASSGREYKAAPRLQK